MSYNLYWCPFSGSLAPMAVLEEIGAPYEKILIDIDTGANRSAEYLKIHPLGLLPAIQLPGGQYIFESAGICIYLADRHPEFKLAPEADDPNRAVYNQWMFFLANTIYTTYGRIYHPERYCIDPSHESGIRALAITQKNNQWKVVEEAIAEHSWLLGKRFSAADIYLLMLSQFDEDQNEFARMFPDIARVAESTSKCEGVHRALLVHARQPAINPAME